MHGRISCRLSGPLYLLIIIINIIIIIIIIIRAFVVVAEDESQRVASGVLHLVPAARRLLRAQHVRRSRRRELPQVPRESGTRGESASGTQACQEDPTQAKKSAFYP